MAANNGECVDGDRKERMYWEVFADINPRHSITIWSLDLVLGNYFGKNELLLALFNLNNVKVLEWKRLEDIGTGVKVSLDRPLDSEELYKIKTISAVQDLDTFTSFEWGKTTNY